MENKIEYVLYKNVQNNIFINRIRPIELSVKKIKKTANGIVMEEFYNFSAYKNIKTLQELSDALEDGEYLAIDLTQVKKDDLLKEDKIYEKIKESIDETKIIEYVYHDLEIPIERRVGEKLYLIKLEDMKKEQKKYKDTIVQVKMNDDDTCTWESISFTSKHKKELDEELYFKYGGFSGLYYLIPEEGKEEFESYYEITKEDDNQWHFIKMNKGRNK